MKACIILDEMKIHAGHIEIAVAKLVGWRTHVIVPNVSWGLGLSHECDMLVLDHKKRFTEVEIKVSASDLKRDFSKSTNHKSQYISRLIYAMPDRLCESHAHIIPTGCGIIAVAAVDENTFRARWWRMCRYKKTAPVPEQKIIKFMELGCMRIWSLKNANYHLQQRLRKKDAIVLA